MALFSQSAQPSQVDSETQKTINELIRRLNNIDRRVRISEQMMVTQKQLLDNTGGNLIKLRKDMAERIKSIETSRSEIAQGFHELEEKVKALSLKIESLPSKQHLSELKTTIDLQKPSESESSLDDALELLGGIK